MRANKENNMKLKFKLAGTLAALALVAGAVPMTVSSAGAVDRGQHLDRGKFPRTWHIVLGIGIVIAAMVLISGSNDRPTSP
jgi:hypothetical protein